MKIRVASILIDDLIKVENEERGKFLQKINKKCYIAKPNRPYHPFFRKIRAAWRVLIGKSMAVHYKIDE